MIYLSLILSTILLTLYLIKLNLYEIKHRDDTPSIPNRFDDGAGGANE